jgi:hypothetical protein
MYFNLLLITPLPKGKCNKILNRIWNDQGSHSEGFKRTSMDPEHRKIL